MKNHLKHLAEAYYKKIGYEWHEALAHALSDDTETLIFPVSKHYWFAGQKSIFCIICGRREQPSQPTSKREPGRTIIF